jgi:ABC-2 type transport system permease protein
MIIDIYTILWKELKELLIQRGRFRGGLLGLLFFIVVLGILMPVQFGPTWLESAIPLIYWSWIPFMMVNSVIADTFAGERERHTLETLLASRLSDRAILFGKIASAIVYGWGLTMVCVLLGLVSINLVYSRGQIILYPLDVGLAIPVFSFLIAGLASGLGVLISLRSATVRQAQQTFSIVFYLFFVPMFLLPLLPENITRRVFTFLLSTNLQVIAVLAFIFLISANIVLIYIATLRFKRNRLILD